MVVMPSCKVRERESAPPKLLFVVARRAKGRMEGGEGEGGSLTASARSASFLRVSSIFCTDYRTRVWQGSAERRRD